MVDIDNARIWTTVSGKGPGLVLCHGGPGNFDTLGPIAQMVDDLVTVFRYDQRASGRSTGCPPLTVDRFVDDLEELRSYWNQEQLIVGGHSWGANLALAYCLKYPQRARALIYISGPGIIWDWQDEFKANQNKKLSPIQQTRLSELKQLRKTSDNAEISREILQLLYIADLADSMNLHLLEANGFFQYPMNWNVNSALNEDWIQQSHETQLEEQTKSLKLPALIIHGQADPRPIQIANKMHELLPNSQFVTLPAVGHIPWLESPHCLQDALRNFLIPLI